MERGPGAGDRRCLPRKSWRGERGDEALDAALAAAFRSYGPAARGKRPLWLSGAHDPVAGAGALRKTQGAYLSPHGRTRAAGGLSAHGETHAGKPRRAAQLWRLLAADPTRRMGQAE